MVAKTPECDGKGSYITFNSIRKSNFCTKILIKLRPIAVAGASLIGALMIPFWPYLTKMVNMYDFFLQFKMWLNLANNVFSLVYFS